MTSSYLLRRRRGLKEACLEIMAARGRPPPCDCCSFGDLCQRSLGDPPKEEAYISEAGQSLLQADGIAA